MKKLMTMLLAFAMLCSLAACGADEADYSVENEKTHAESSEGVLEVHYIDVGQADATLLMCGGQNMLIDGGNAEDSDLIYSYLEDYNVETLDYMICTHAHEDHIGGLGGALNYAEVETVYCPVEDYDTEVFDDLVRLLDAQGKKITVPEAGMTFMLGEAECQILGLNVEDNDPNNTSIVLRVEFGDTAFLFSGDAEQSVEKAILDAGYDVSCDVLKVPHHGSDTSLSYRWLNESMPEYAVISVGKDNSYGHPNDDTLSKLRDADVEVYRTDIHGHIVCRSDGKTVALKAARNADKPTKEDPGKKTQDASGAMTYVLNDSTMKFHYPSCSSVKKMNDKNKTEITATRDELIDQGYDPCGNCEP